MCINIDKARNNKPLVAIQCITYNHESYIRDTLEGFVMQKTKFPFVAIVHDDASTDGTAAIIREYAKKYPDIIKPIFETENQFSKKDGSLSRIVNQACITSGAEYIAYCEGDDYWIDNKKLEKQVTFLQNNPNYTLSYSKAIRRFENLNRENEISTPAINNLEDLLKANYITTATVVIRTSVLIDYQNNIPTNALKGVQMGDYQIWLHAASIGKIHAIPDFTTVYRVLNTSVSHCDFNKWLHFLLSANKIKQYYSQKYDLLHDHILYENLILKICLSIKNHDKQQLSILLSECNHQSKECLDLKFKRKFRLLSLFPLIYYHITKLKFKNDRSNSKILKVLGKFKRKLV